MLEASAKGDYTSLHQALEGARPFEEFKPRQEAQWKRRREQFGEFKGVKILGTVPAQGGYMTTAQLDFERGAEYMQFMWGGGILRGFRFSASAPGTLFFPQSATDFVSFNLTTNESMALSFKSNEGGVGFQVALQAASTPTAKPKNEAGKMPDTAAGRIATAYLKAFNSGDENVMREFFLNHLSKSSLASRSMEERLKMYHRMHDDMGKLEAQSVSDANEQRVTISMQVKEGDALEMRFELDPAEPQKLKGLRIERR